jgi:hypothetical protein
VLALSATDYYLAAGGSDIWNQADGCHFLYQEKTGDFDVAVQIESLTRPNEWAKATLMVREDLDGNSRNYLALVAPPAVGNPAGMNLFNAQWRDVKGGTTVSLSTAERPSPVPYPNAWLRLTRTGDAMKTYYGTNGTDWTLLNSYTPPTPYPAKTYVGVAVTSHNNGSSEASSVRTLIRNLKGFGTPSTPVTSPLLAIKKVGGNVVISWTSSSSKFVLQSTASLSSKNWQSVSATPTVNGNDYSVTVAIGATPLFYRLISQ